MDRESGAYYTQQRDSQTGRRVTDRAKRYTETDGETNTDRHITERGRETRRMSLLEIVRERGEEERDTQSVSLFLSR